MKLLCNVCNKELKKQRVDGDTISYFCKCISDIHRNIFYGLKNDKINFYDIYHNINGSLYNLESYDKNTTIYDITKDCFSVIYKCSFHHLISDNPTQEAIDFIIKIVNLKAFI